MTMSPAMDQPATATPPHFTESENACALQNNIVLQRPLGTRRARTGRRDVLADVFGVERAHDGPCFADEAAITDVCLLGEMRMTAVVDGACEGAAKLSLELWLKARIDGRLLYLVHNAGAPGCELGGWWPIWCGGRDVGLVVDRMPIRVVSIPFGVGATAAGVMGNKKGADISPAARR
jgi:hypothetical protein